MTCHALTFSRQITQSGIMNIEYIYPRLYKITTVW